MHYLGRRPRPVCMPLPGGVSKFCGRVYNVERQGEEFNACLGLELRALQEVEASLRAFCFRFGPQGLKVLPPQPLPVIQEGINNENEEDDEDEDDYTFDDDDDDDDDDEEEEDDNDVDADYEGFGLLDDDFIGGLFSEDGDGNPTRKRITTTKAPLRKGPHKSVKPFNKKTQRTKITTTKTVSKVQTSTKPIEFIKVTAKPEITEIKEHISTSTIVPNNVAINTISNEVPDESHMYFQILQSKPTETVAFTEKNEETGAFENIMDYETIKNVSVNITSNENIIHTTEPNAETKNVTFIQKTTILDQQFTTEIPLEIEEDEEDENNSELVQSYIIKKDEEDDDSEESDPITSVVEDVLGVDDDKSKKKAIINDKVENVTKKTKKESKDVVDDIFDGVVDTIAGESDESTSTKADKLSNTDDDDDDDSDEDDDDILYDESDEDDDDKSRKMISPLMLHSKSRRQSKDMAWARSH